MFVSWLRFWLPLLSIAMLLASSIGLAWSIFAVVQVGVAPTERTEPTHAQRLANKVDGSLSFGDFPLDRKYQGPLFDPPPKAPPAAVKKERPPLPVKLLATMPEPNGGCAMFTDSSGATIIKSVGETVTNAGIAVEFIEVSNDYVKLRYDGETIVLKMPEK